MKKSDISKYMAENGRRGGRARAKSTTAAQRHRIAMKAAKVSAQVRKVTSK